MSKFKLTPAAKTAVSTKPATEAEFVAAAAMVQSQAGTRPPKPVRLNLDLDPETHRALKIRATENGVSIAQLVRTLIARELG